MNNILQQKVLAALENAGFFTSGGLVKDKVIKNGFYIILFLGYISMKITEVGFYDSSGYYKLWVITACK